MSLQPIQQEPVQSSAQVLLAFLSDENVRVPSPMLEGIVSVKSLMRGIISGHLFICEKVDAPDLKQPGDESPGDSPPAQ